MEFEMSRMRQFKFSNFLINVCVAPLVKTIGYAFLVAMYITTYVLPFKSLLSVKKALSIEKRNSTTTNLLKTQSASYQYTYRKLDVRDVE